MLAKSGNLNQDPAGLHRLTLEPGQENRNKARNRKAKRVCLSSLWMTQFLTPWRKLVALELALPLTWNSNLDLSIKH